MGDIRFDLLNPVDTGALTQQGFATGMAMVKQVQQRNALRSYLANPDDPQAYNALAYLDPQAASTLQQQRAFQRQDALARQQAAVKLAVGRQAATGDVAGAKATALSAGDFELIDTLNKMGDDERKQTVDRYVGTAPIAYQTSKLPYEKRKDYLASATPELKALGWTDQQLSGFDPTDAALAAIVGTGSKLSELVAADKPQYIATQPGGGVVRVGGGQPSSLVIAPNPGDKQTGAPVVTTGGTGGSTPGPNNPGALRVPGSKQFQSFATPEEGAKAQEAQLGRYFNRGLNTVRKVVETYAPRAAVGGDNSDASVNNYIQYAAHRLGVNPDDALSTAVLPKLAAAMREFETGKRQTAAINAPIDKERVKADALEAIALGADPAKVKAAAAAHGVTI